MKIGYPDKWIDYSTLLIKKGDDDFLTMVFKARQFDNEQDNKEMNAPTDKLKWVRILRMLVAIAALLCCQCF